MTLWAQLNGTPPRGFYAGSKPSGAPELSYDRLLSVSTIRWGAHLSGGDEAANCSLIIDNGDRELTAEFISGVLKQSVTIYDDALEVFSGLVDRISLGAEITLDLVADGLSETVALRRTTVYAAPFADAVIPHVIGVQKIRPIRYSADGRRWLLADHACAGIVTATLDGDLLAAVAMVNTRDEAEHSVCILQTNEAIDDDQELFVTMQGLLNDDGELATNPAEVIEYLVSTIGGQDLTLAEMDRFRADCARQPIALNLLFDDDSLTYRGAIDRIMQSVGGVWSSGLPGFARLWPLTSIPADEPIYETLSATDDFSDAECALDDIVTELTIEFDYEPAQTRFRQSMTLKAQAAEDIYGQRKASIEAPALATRREVALLGGRLLMDLARPRWRQPVLVAGDNAVTIPPGVLVDVTATHLPISGQVIISGVERNYDEHSATLELEQAVGTAPAILLVQSSQLASPTESPVTVQYGDDIAIITARAPDGSLLPGATITLGGVSRIADAQGQARFVIDPGVYELRVNADGYDEQIVSDFSVGL